MPKYGGVFVEIQPTDTRTFDDGYVWASQAWTLALTNEAIFIGDWARGPAGTNESTWSLQSGFATMERFETHGLAESYEIDQGAASVTFHIRQGVYFHNKAPVNGRLMDANDIAYSISRNYAVPGSFLHLNFPNPTSVVATDKWTCVVKFNSFGDLTKNIAEMTTLLTIWPKESVEANKNDMRDWRASVGTGSFMMTDYVKGNSATFVRNPNYWDKDPIGSGKGNQLPYLDGVKVLIIGDSSTQLAAMRTAKADLARFPWDVSESLVKTNPELKYSKYLNNSVQAIGLREDIADAPWKKLEVRQALWKAIDFKAIVANYYGGNAEWYDFPTAPNIEYKDMQVPFDELPERNKDLWTYDPVKAKQMLVDAGYANGFDVEVVCGTPSYNAYHVDVLSIIKDYWSKVGVNLTLNIQEQAVYLSMGNGRSYKQGYIGSANTPMVLNMTPWTNTTRNYSFINVPHYEDVHNQIWDEYLNDAKKFQLWKDVSIDIMYNAWEIPTPVEYNYTFWQPWVSGCGGYHGEYAVGNSTFNFPKWLWIDTALKQSMTK